MEGQDTTLSELMLAASWADTNVKMHQGAPGEAPRCRAWARLERCSRCEHLEDEVIRTDQALRHFWASLGQGAA